MGYKFSIDQRPKVKERNPKPYGYKYLIYVCDSTAGKLSRLSPKLYLRLPSLNLPKYNAAWTLLTLKALLPCTVRFDAYMDRATYLPQRLPVADKHFPSLEVGILHPRELEDHFRTKLLLYLDLGGSWGLEAVALSWKSCRFWRRAGANSSSLGFSFNSLRVVLSRFCSTHLKTYMSMNPVLWIRIQIQWIRNDLLYPVCADSYIHYTAPFYR